MSRQNVETLDPSRHPSGGYAGDLRYVSEGFAVHQVRFVRRPVSRGQLGIGHEVVGHLLHHTLRLQCGHRGGSARARQVVGGRKRRAVGQPWHRLHDSGMAVGTSRRNRADPAHRPPELTADSIEVVRFDGRGCRVVGPPSSPPVSSSPCPSSLVLSSLVSVSLLSVSSPPVAVRRERDPSDPSAVGASASAASTELHSRSYHSPLPEGGSPSTVCSGGSSSAGITTYPCSPGITNPRRSRACAATKAGSSHNATSRSSCSFSCLNCSDSASRSCCWEC